jgi:Flp pilus assembly protein TadG
VSARRRDDRGAAAVELGILLTVVLLVAALIYPLGVAFYEKIRLGRASGDAIRFATATPNTPAYGSTARRPSTSEIEAEAIRAYSAAGGSGLTASDVVVTGGRRPGDTVRIQMTKSVDLGPLGSLLSALNVTSSQSIAISVNASGREE